MKITKEILEAAVSGDMRELRAIPKSDLHAHLLLSAPFGFMSGLSRGAIPRPPPRFADLETFLDHVREFYFPTFTSVEVYRGITRAAFDHMIADGIVYTEASFDLAMPLLLDMSWADLAAALRSELERVCGRLTVRAELGVARDFAHPRRQALVVEALDTGFFESVDLYGAEMLKPAGEFIDYVNEARRRRLKIKMHSGETSPPERMIEEVSLIRPHGVQHGVRAAEDARALALLAGMGIEVNVCPYSNWCLNVVSEYAAHPIRRMFDAGVKVTLNSDDYTIFGRSVSEEYAALYAAGVFSAEELERIRQNGLGAAGGAAC